MSEWTSAPLGDFVTFQRGLDITQKAQLRGSVPVVSSGGISSHHNEAAASGPGVVIGRKGTLGKAFYLEGEYWPHDTTLWVRDFHGNHPKFVYYFMSKLDVSWLDAGSANPTLNRNHLHPLLVTWPPPNEQQAIAEVLGALDDKIAVNTALATKAGDLVHAEFRAIAAYAQHTGTTFDEVAQINGGGTPSTSDASYWDGSIRWATPTDLTALAGPYLADTSRKISEKGLAACSTRLFAPGAILMTSRATIGALAVNTVPTAVNQGFIVVEPHDARMRWWLFHQMRARIDEFLSWANGATFLELSRGNFKRLPVWIPSASSLQQFAEFADPLHELARVALAENRTLATTRDALLPQLMSGKLRVRDAEAAASAAGV